MKASQGEEVRHFFFSLPRNHQPTKITACLRCTDHLSLKGLNSSSTLVGTPQTSAAEGREEKRRYLHALKMQKSRIQQLIIQNLLPVLFLPISYVKLEPRDVSFAHGGFDIVRLLPFMHYSLTLAGNRLVSDTNGWTWHIPDDVSRLLAAWLTAERCERCPLAAQLANTRKLMRSEKFHAFFYATSTIAIVKCKNEFAGSWGDLQREREREWIIT